MIQINPYRRNCEVLKNFFGKPIILIIPILFFISAISSVAVNILAGNTLTFPLVKLMSAIGFLFFYLKGRKKSEVTSFGQPVNTLTTAGILSIVANVLGLVIIALMLIFEYSLNLSENILSYYLLEDAIDLLIFNAPVCVMYIISSIASLVLLGSIKKSSKSIYLFKTGSLFFVITCFVTALVLIGLNVYQGISIALISPAIDSIVLIMLGVFAIMYNRYITNVSSNISVPKPVAETIDTTPQPVQAPVVHIPQDRAIPTANESSAHKKSSKRVKPDYDASLVNMWDIPNNSVAPNTPAPKDFTPQNASFDPQPVFAQPTPDYDYPDSPILAQDTALPVQPFQNTYEPQPVFTENNTKTENAKPVEEKTFSFCTFCGQKCPPENLYCGACGNKLTK